MSILQTLSPRRWVLRRRAVEEAREAITRFYNVPYLRELTVRERHGILILEERGLLERDEGFASELHWHLTDRGRDWLYKDTRRY